MDLNLRGKPTETQKLQLAELEAAGGSNAETPVDTGGSDSNKDSKAKPAAPTSAGAPTGSDTSTTGTTGTTGTATTRS